MCTLYKSHPFAGHTQQSARPQYSSLHSDTHDYGISGVEDELGQYTQLTGEHSYVSEIERNFQIFSLKTFRRNYLFFKQTTVTKALKNLVLFVTLYDSIAQNVSARVS